jgi:hypothetical protein
VVKALLSLSRRATYAQYLASGSGSQPRLASLTSVETYVLAAHVRRHPRHRRALAAALITAR